MLLLQEAKEKFQQLQKVISILGDEEKRTVYDQTGCVDDDVSKYSSGLCNAPRICKYSVSPHLFM